MCSADYAHQPASPSISFIPEFYPKDLAYAHDALHSVLELCMVLHG
jgi:hypothetical protein